LIGPTHLGQRDFTILYLAAAYGLRCSELVDLTLDGIDWPRHTLRVSAATKPGLSDAEAQDVVHHTLRQLWSLREC
jgi:hypothetical protein